MRLEQDKINEVTTMMKKFRLSAFLAIAAIFMLFMTFTSVTAADTTRPMVLSVSPTNNDEGNTRTERITVVFSEDMDPSTINADTITVMQRTTPASGDYRSLGIDGNVTYSDRKVTFSGITYSNRTATFIQDEQFSPSQQYGNVFTVTITAGVKDLAGNSIPRNYISSFTTGTAPFHKDSTTSQSNQTSANRISNVTAVVPPVEPVVVPPVTGVSSATGTASTFPWVWLVGGLLLVALIWGLLIFATKQESRKNVQASRPDPFGDVHPVIDIEGIGQEYNKRLSAMGIKNTKQLWDADAGKVARTIGASLGSVKSWQQMAELASVKDIGPQYAELLERSGVHSIGQLKSSDPDALLRRVRKKQRSLQVNIQGNSPGHATVEHWIHEARDHRFSESQIA